MRKVSKKTLSGHAHFGGNGWQREQDSTQRRRRLNSGNPQRILAFLTPGGILSKTADCSFGASDECRGSTRN
eukprot:6208041-Pleurochrysis_carterae.AAC.1